MQEEDAVIDADVRDAIAELDAWEGPAFKIRTGLASRRNRSTTETEDADPREEPTAAE